MSFLKEECFKFSTRMIFDSRYATAMAELNLPLEEDHSATDVKKAYKARAMATHPDKNPPEEKELWEERFKKVGAAHETLQKELVNPTPAPQAQQRPAYTPPPRCTYCGKYGHTEDQCFRRMRDEAKPTCAYCGIRGHSVDRCFKRMKDENSCGHCREAGRPCNHRVDNCHFIHPCHICGKTGHLARQCRWRGVPKCSHCGDFGHRVQRCFKLHPHLDPKFSWRREDGAHNGASYQSEEHGEVV